MRVLVGERGADAQLARFKDVTEDRSLAAEGSRQVVLVRHDQGSGNLGAHFELADALLGTREFGLGRIFLGALGAILPQPSDSFKKNDEAEEVAPAYAARLSIFGLFGKVRPRAARILACCSSGRDRVACRWPSRSVL